VGGEVELPCRCICTSSFKPASPQVSTVDEGFVNGRGVNTSTALSAAVKVTPKLLVELGVCRSPKAAHNTLKYLEETGLAEAVHRGVYLLYPGSRTYVKVSAKLAERLGDLRAVECGFAGFGVGGWRGRWLAVLCAGLEVGWVEPGWVSRWFGVSRFAACMLLRRMVRAGLLVRVGRGRYAPAFAFGVTRVDSGGRHVSVSTVLNGGVRAEHHPRLGCRLLKFVDWRRGGYVQVAYAKRGSPPGLSRYMQLYRYKFNNEWWIKIEPTIHVKAPRDALSLEARGLMALREYFKEWRPLLRVLGVA